MANPLDTTMYQQAALVANQANVVSADPTINASMEKISVLTTCSHCRTQVFTNVESNFSGSGWFWALWCCCCGLCLLSILVTCLDYFREWRHYCPTCKRLLAIYNPSARDLKLVLLFYLWIVVVILGIIIIYAYYYILPMTTYYY